MSAKRPQPRPKRRASETHRQHNTWQAARCEDAQQKMLRTHAWSASPNQALLFGEKVREVSASSALKSPVVGTGLLIILVGLMKRVI